DGLLFLRGLGEHDAGGKQKKEKTRNPKSDIRNPVHPGLHAFSTSCGFGAARTAEVWITSGSVLPRTGTSARYAVSNCPFKSSRVASLKMSLVFISLLRLSSRDARLTVSPSTVYSILSSEPIFPTTPGPL